MNIFLPSFGVRKSRLNCNGQNGIIFKISQDIFASISRVITKEGAVNLADCMKYLPYQIQELGIMFS